MVTLVGKLILPPSCCRDFRFRPQILRQETSRTRAVGAWAAAEVGEGAPAHRPAVGVPGPGPEVTVAPMVLAPLAPPPTRASLTASLTAPDLLWKLASSEILGKLQNHA